MTTVLVVDDAMFMRATMKRILEEYQFNIVGEAANGTEAIEQYKKLQPSIVTMDITMPGISGIEAVREIIAFDPKAKIIMVSALGQQKLIVDALDAGAKDFVTKPFDPDQLIQVLRNVIDI